MKVITVINDQLNVGFNLLRLSCSANNLDLLVLVSSQKNFYSNRLKDDLLLNYLEHYASEDEMIFFTDGNDAILLCPEDEILSKYKKLGKAVIFSAESACWPDKNLSPQYPATASAYRYLNSGGFIGRAGVIRQLLTDVVPFDDEFQKSNQYLWAKRFFANGDLIALDTECEIFHTFSPEVADRHKPLAVNRAAHYSCMKNWFMTNFTIENGRIFSKLSGTWPCHAHFNGSSKIIMDYDVTNMVFSQIGDRQKVRFVDGLTHAPLN